MGSYPWIAGGALLIRLRRWLRIICVSGLADKYPEDAIGKALFTQPLCMAALALALSSHGSARMWLKGEGEEGRAMGGEAGCGSVLQVQWSCVARTEV